jgi:molybdate/tungstate transport system substrate-binding protein
MTRRHTLKAQRRSLALALALAVLCSCKGPGARPKPLYVFAAASLNTALAELEKTFERKRPDIDVRVEISGSLVAARKVSEYKRRGDIVVAADKRVIASLLIPDFTDWQIAFVSNEMVLAYSEKSRHAVEISSANWFKILLDPEVRVARVDENLGPLGYQTLLVWKLADLHHQKELQGTSLFDTLRKKVTRELIRPDAAELLPVLGTDADYIFLYRSMAKDHNLKHILLPSELNLSSFDYRDFYAKASVTIAATPDQPLTVRGEPILYSATIVRNAPNPDGAFAFIKMLLGGEGKTVLKRHGYAPLSPPQYHGPRGSFPESLHEVLPHPGTNTEIME